MENDHPRGSYAALASYLEDINESLDAITMRFEEVEDVLGRSLPRSAYDYRAWWGNDTANPQAASWLAEGWKTRAVDMNNRTLVFERTTDLSEAYIKFFSDFLRKLREHSPFQVKQLSPQGNSYQRLVALNRKAPERVLLNACFTRSKEFRVEVYIDYPKKAKNKAVFDRLHQDKDQLEALVGEPLHWERLDDKKACRIATYTVGHVMETKELERISNWGVRKATALFKAFSNRVD